MKWSETQRALLILSIVLTAIIFIADLFTPLGIAWGFVYIIVVLFTLWVPGKISSVWFALAGIILTAFCFFVKPAPEVAAYIVLVNRSLSIIGILVTMFGILKYKEKEQIVREQKEKL